MSDLELPLIVEPSELVQHLGRADLLIVDLSDRTTLTRLVGGHRCLPGAVHLDRHRIMAAHPPAMGLAPEEPQLGEVLSSIGLTPEKHVIAYDNTGNANACRLLWILDLVGHPGSSLLNGGLGAWIDAGHPTEKRFHSARPSDYTAVLRAGPMADKEYVLAHLDDPAAAIVDSRSEAEFAGGHIPGANNLDWALAVDAERNMRLKPEAELRRMFEDHGVTPDKQVITYCVVHLRSAHTYVVLKALGYPRIKGYPGSWSEWGNTPGLPAERQA